MSRDLNLSIWVFSTHLHLATANGSARNAKHKESRKAMFNDEEPGAGERIVELIFRLRYVSSVIS